MRGQVQKQTEAFSYIMIEDRVPQKHPLRKVKTIANTLIAELDPLFDSIYSSEGRPSIAPEYLLRASILQILYTIRSERNLMEHIDFNILFRWFVGLGLDAPVWDHSTFTKNRERFLESEVAHQFFGKVVEHARQKGLLSDDHFTVDGTLIEAWASMKSFQPKTPSDSDTDAGSAGKNPEVDFHGEKRTNATHASKTDPDARLYKKSAGSASKLCYMGHVLMENRNGLVVKNTLTHASGTAEREAALLMMEELGTTRHRTLGGDKGYDADNFVQALRDRNITPHIAPKKNSIGIDRRTTRHEGFKTSQRIRKRVEEIFGWAKTVGMIRKVKLRGLKLVTGLFAFNMAVYNLIRIGNLEVQT